MNVHKVFIGAILGAVIFVCGDIGMAFAYPAPYTCSRNFYVATAGSDSAGCGTSQANACASIQGANNNIALQGGDCVNVAAGIYTATNTVSITKGGSSNQANGYVTYIGAPNHASILKWTGGYYGMVIQDNVGYVMFDGFEFNGNASLGDALITDNEHYPGAPHHLWFLNNIIHESQGGGVVFHYGDYYYYLGNVVHDTQWGAPYGQSGLYIYEARQIPGFTATLAWDTQYYHIQVIGNTVYSNGCIRETSTQNCGTATYGAASHTDGNGVDFDDFQNQQTLAHTPYPPYPYHALLMGNIAYGNGGRGFSIDPGGVNVDMYNNTSYNNGLDTINTGEADFMMGGSNNNVANNIFMGVAANVHGKSFQWNGAYGMPDTGNTFQNNITWNGTTGSQGVILNGCGSCSMAAFTNNKLGVNPLLTSPTTDFHPQSGSPVIGAGVTIPTGVLPGPVNNADGLAFPNPPNIGALNSSAPISVAGPVSISAGGPAASPYIADAGFNGGTPAGGYTGAIDTSLVANPAPQSVYQNQRYGNSFFYVVSGLTPGKNYQTVLHFTEDYDTAAGQRQENVTINGTQVLNAFDIFAAAGAQHKAVAKSFNAAADANGNLTISFAGTAGLADPNAKVDGVQVLTVTAPPLAANESATTPYKTAVNVNLAAGATGNPTSAAIVGTPFGGAVTLNGLTATFTPSTGFTGSASFQFTLSNAGGASNTAAATVTVGTPPAPGQVEDFQYLSGDWYLPDLVLPATAGPSATGPNIIRCAPGGLRNNATIGNVGARVFTADPAGHLQFAIYTNGANQRPANLVATSASMPAAAAGIVSSALSANVQGGPGGANFADTFWFCANSDSSAARFASVNSVPSVEAAIIGAGSAGNVLQAAGTGLAISHLSTPGTYGSWPASLASATWTEQTSNAMPMMAVRFSSVP